MTSNERADFQLRDIAVQMDLDRPRQFARNRRLIAGAVAAWSCGIVLVGCGVYRLLSGL